MSKVATIMQSVGTCHVGPWRALSINGVETAYGRGLRLAEERRLAARSPAEVARDEKRKRADDEQQRRNWAALYRAAGLR